MINKEIISFNFTEIGYSHIRQEKVCEDCSCSFPNWTKKDAINLNYDNIFEYNKMHICIIADGHGSDNYPRANKGSNFAVKSTMECIVDFLLSSNNDDLKEILKNDSNSKGEKENLHLKNLAKAILNKWYFYINEDLKNNEFTINELEKVDDNHRKKYEKVIKEFKNTNNPSNGILNGVAKAYGTTLICFVRTEKFCFGMQIGDGKCIALGEDGKFFQPIPWDVNCYGNVTTSLSDTDAIDNDEFRFYFSENNLIAVFCGSDGVDDSYKNDEDLYSFYRWICKNFKNFDYNEALNKLKEYLPIMSKGGSCDDISIAGIIDIDGLKNMEL